MDDVDAKGFKWSKLLCVTKGSLQLLDVDEDEIEQQYTQAPVRPKITKKEILSNTYKMDYPRRGRALIINNKHFSSDLEARGLGVRTGTDIDATKISKRLELLGFDVDRNHNVSCKAMRKLFENAANEDHSDADCFVCVMMSHGETDKIYGTDAAIDIKEIFDYFKGEQCKTLAGKPKLFFIQACRGTQLDKGATMNVVDAKRDFTTPLPEAPPENDIRIPSEADFLISYSTVPGYYSWRNSASGSWFIQCLVRILDECGTTTELLKLLTRVNRLVAFNFQSNTLPKEPDMHASKQIPSFTSMLTKDLFFLPKKT